jgi:hypothetical protein
MCSARLLINDCIFGVFIYKIQKAAIVCPYLIEIYYFGIWAELSFLLIHRQAFDFSGLML